MQMEVSDIKLRLNPAVVTIKQFAYKKILKKVQKLA